MGERGYWLNEQNSVENGPKSSLFDPETKNSCMFEVKIAEFRSKAASSIQREKQLHVRG